jgi:hypothetical protein
MFRPGAVAFNRLINVMPEDDLPGARRPLDELLALARDHAHDAAVREPLAVRRFPCPSQIL